MQPFLIIKTGSTLETMRARRGDFEDWIINGMGLAREQALVADVEHEEPLPDDFGGIAGVVVGGSHSMVTEQQPWSENAARWIAGAVGRGLPVLGICYGHQLLAYALGGAVDFNPRGLEVGVVPLQRYPAAARDPLLGGLPDPVRVYVSHAQSVIKLPPGATLLASSAMDPHQAFVINNRAWGVQFHPEFDADVSRTYAETISESEFPGITHIRAEICDTPYGSQILHRFVGVAFSLSA